MDKEKRKMDKFLRLQKEEISGYFIYKNLVKSEKNSSNKKIFGRIAKDELEHYNILKKYTEREISPDFFDVKKHIFISKILGLTFGLKLMEKVEKKREQEYKKMLVDIPETKKMLADEKKHEKDLINILNEEKLKYISSIVLGLNDALVELTGALAGLTFALQNASLVALTGGITGIAASFSMASSEYLAKKSDGNKDALKAAVYTGIAYILTVLLLIAPFLILRNLYFSLGIALATSILIIFFFTYYISIAKDYSFKAKFFEMFFISLGIAAISFGVGYLIRIFFGVEV